MIEFHELPSVVIQADKILALRGTAGLAVSCQWKDQPTFSKRPQHRVIENRVKRRGDGAVLRREPAGRVEEPQVMRKSEMQLGMPALDAFVGQPMGPEQRHHSAQGDPKVTLAGGPLAMDISLG